jgi:multidrug efflux pump subunit AcrB
LQKIRDTPFIAQGKTLKLSDVATVERGYEDPPTLQIRNQHEPALLLGIVMREGWNGLALGKRWMPKRQKSMPVCRWG